ncbi:hypothetical protein F4777DRAFT_575364 [Nemania sp. FL0916]|nr:hypothetical protein F4777DRAFT_575364 [Nemania sp. FL0916]
MQPRTSQQESLSSLHRSTSFRKSLQNILSPSKKFIPSLSSPSPTSQEQSPGTTPPSSARPRRHHAPTEEDLINNITALQSSLTRTWPRRHYSRYRNARALLVCWADNDGFCTHAPVYSSHPSHSHPQCESPLGFPILDDQWPNPPPRASSVAPGSASMARLSQDARHGPFIPAAYQLAGVLERRYGIQAQVWMIPSLDVGPQDMLLGKVKQFVDEYGQEGNLLLFWYGGRAEFVGDGGGEGEVCWYGLSSQPGISARFVTKALGTARADVLMLNDSPFSQHVYASNINGPGTFELLGSGCTSTSTTTSSPSTSKHSSSSSKYSSSSSSTGSQPHRLREASFTRTLALMLDSPFLADNGVSIVELHRKLLDNMAPRRRSLLMLGSRQSGGGSLPVLSLSLNNNINRSNDGRYERAETEKTSFSSATGGGPLAYPIYCQIAQSTPLERDARRSIVLSRLDAQLVPGGPGNNHPRTEAQARLTLNVTLARPYLDVRRWREWILRAPDDVVKIGVRSVVGNGG